MSKTIDFVTVPAGVDTGDASASSIAPVSNGEGFTAAVINRSPEALRQRTEKLRVEANEARWLRENDKHVLFALTGGSIVWEGTVASTGTGRLVLTPGESLLLIPATSPGAPTGAPNEGTGTRFPTRYYQASVTDGVHSLDFTAKIFEYEGAFDLSIEAEDVTGIGVVTISVLGDATVADPSTQPGRRQIVVQYDSTEPTHTLGAVKTAIDAHPVASLLVDVTASLVGHAMFDVTRTWFSGGADGVFHEITAANLVAAFTAGLELKEGSTLAIWFDTVLQRKASVEETNMHLVPAASLVVLTEDNAEAPNAVHLGRVVNNEFVFVSTGTTLAVGAVQTTISNNSSALRQDLRNSDIPILDATYNAATVGSDIIGVNANDWVHIAGSPTNLTQTLDTIDSSLTVLDVAGSRYIRGDVNRGLAVVPLPSPNDAAVFGAEYVGINPNHAYSSFTPTYFSAQEALTFMDNLITKLENRSKHFDFPGQALGNNTTVPAGQFFRASSVDVFEFADADTIATTSGVTTSNQIVTDGRYICAQIGSASTSAYLIDTAVSPFTVDTVTFDGVTVVNRIAFGVGQVIAVGLDGSSNLVISAISLANTASKWTASHGVLGLVRAIAVNPTHIFVAAGETGVPTTIRRYNAIDGSAPIGASVDWSTDDAIVNSMLCVGTGVYVSGAATNTGAFLKHYVFSVGVTETVIDGGGTQAAHKLVADRSALYCVVEDNPVAPTSWQLRAYNLFPPYGELTGLAARYTTAARMRITAVDDAYVYYNTEVGTLGRIPKRHMRDGSMVTFYPTSTSNNAIAFDGIYFYSIDSGVGVRLTSMDSRARLFRRRAATDSTVQQCYIIE